MSDRHQQLCRSSSRRGLTERVAKRTESTRVWKHGEIRPLWWKKLRGKRLKKKERLRRRESLNREMNRLRLYMEGSRKGNNLRVLPARVIKVIMVHLTNRRLWIQKRKRKRQKNLPCKAGDSPSRTFIFLDILYNTLEVKFKFVEE